MTHTPGPWFADGTDIYAGPDQLVATTTSMSIYSLQNARLIAAAPALLEALESLAERLDGIENHSRAKWSGYTIEAAMYELRADIEMAQRHTRHAIEQAKEETITP